MRDRMRARNYSPERERFRREHERHRAWGLARRHEEKLRRIRESRGEDQSAAIDSRSPNPSRAPRPVTSPGSASVVWPRTAQGGPGGSPGSASVVRPSRVPAGPGGLPGSASAARPRRALAGPGGSPGSASAARPRRALADTAGSPGSASMARPQRASADRSGSPNPAPTVRPHCQPVGRSVRERGRVVDQMASSPKVDDLHPNRLNHRRCSRGEPIRRNGRAALRPCSARNLRQSLGRTSRGRESGAGRKTSQGPPVRVHSAPGRQHGRSPSQIAEPSPPRPINQPWLPIAPVSLGLMAAVSLAPMVGSFLMATVGACAPRLPSVLRTAVCLPPVTGQSPPGRSHAHLAERITLSQPAGRGAQPHHWKMCTTLDADRESRPAARPSSLLSA
jgi:hypothetical protein